MELNVMENVFCPDRRNAPLKVGSIKSNIGHCEVAGFFVSIAKAIIAIECGYIPPNINYNVPNKNVSAIKSGKIQVRRYIIIGVGFGYNNRLGKFQNKFHKKKKK